MSEREGPRDHPTTGTSRRADLADRLRLMGFSQREATAIVGEFFELIIQALERGETVKLAGFGRFAAVRRGARQGRNITTGEDLYIGSRRTVVYRPSDKLREALTAALGHDDAGGSS